MLVISSREFREHQKNYLDKIDEGIEILIRRGKNKSYKLVAVQEDDTLMTKEEYFEKLNRSIEQARQGLTIEKRADESMVDFLNRGEKWVQSL